MNSNDYSRPSGVRGTTPLTERLAQFKTKFQEMIGRKSEGYQELSQGLMSGQDREDSRTGFGSSGGYQGPIPGDEFGRAAVYGPTTGPSSGPDASAATDSTMSHLRAQHMQLPSQADDMREAAALANEAGELLWEMVAENEQSEGAFELRDKAQQLQAQLRGLIGDYQDCDEGALESGLKALTVLNTVLEEQHNPTPPQGGAASEEAFSGAAGDSVADTAALPGSSDSHAVPSAPHVPPPNLMDPVPSDDKPLMDI